MPEFGSLVTVWAPVSGPRCDRSLTGLKGTGIAAAVEHDILPGDVATIL